MELGAENSEKCDEYINALEFHHNLSKQSILHSYFTISSPAFKYAKKLSHYYLFRSKRLMCTEKRSDNEDRRRERLNIINSCYQRYYLMSHH